MIDSAQTAVRVPGSEEVISLHDAIHRGLVDPATGTITDPKTGKKSSLEEAVKRGQVVDVQSSEEEAPAAGLTLQQALHQGLLDPKVGAVTDPLSGQKMTLVEAIKAGVIDTSQTVLRIPGLDEDISLQEAIRKGLVDSVSGTVQDPEERRDGESHQSPWASGPSLRQSLNHSVFKKPWPKDSTIPNLMRSKTHSLEM